jgi:hypothetical protein
MRIAPESISFQTDFIPARELLNSLYPVKV